MGTEWKVESLSLRNQIFAISGLSRTSLRYTTSLAALFTGAMGGASCRTGRT
jgi:hypothetical protein